MDKNSGVILELHYYVYEDCDVITRSAKLINESGDVVKLNRLMSLQLDLEQIPTMCLQHFTGLGHVKMGLTWCTAGAGKICKRLLHGNVVEP